MYSEVVVTSAEKSRAESDPCVGPYTTYTSPLPVVTSEREIGDPVGVESRRLAGR
jgi:hypothetical protein